MEFRLKILYVVNGLPPETIGGAENLTHMLAKKMSEAHEVAVFYPVNRSEYENHALLKSKNDYFSIYNINVVGSADLLIENQFFEERFKEILEDFAPDIVHFQILLGSPPSIISIAKEYGAFVLITLHDYWFICPSVTLMNVRGKICNPNHSIYKCIRCVSNENALFRFALTTYSIFYILTRRLYARPLLKSRILKTLHNTLYRKEYLFDMLNRADVFICVSKLQKNFFSEYGVNEDKLIHIPTGIDTTWTKNFRRNKSQLLRFGFIGKIAYHKGVHVLIQAFNDIDSSDVVLNIYGEFQPETNEFHNTIKKMSKLKNNIHFHGNVPHAFEALADIDVVIFPSVVYEGSPITILESFATKTPVVTSNIGGMAELVENMKTGLLFEVGDPQVLREKLDMIIQDRNLIKKLSGNIMNVKTIDEYGREIEEIYKTMKF